MAARASALAPGAADEPSAVSIRPAKVEDGAAIWRLVRDTGVLDLNSLYSYLLLFRRFRETCLVAENDGRAAGFVTAFKPPDDPHTVFVWQVGVDASARGQGIASRLLDRLLLQPACRDVLWLETTVTPSNRASQALFRSLAERHETHCEVSTGFDSSLFGDGDHETEELYRIGPIPSREDAAPAS